MLLFLGLLSLKKEASRHFSLMFPNKIWALSSRDKKEKKKTHTTKERKDFGFSISSAASSKTGSLRGEVRGHFLWDSPATQSSVRLSVHPVCLGESASLTLICCSGLVGNKSVADETSPAFYQTGLNNIIIVISFTNNPPHRAHSTPINSEIQQHANQDKSKNCDFLASREGILNT